ncbi:MAG: hypothetical protein NVS9B10_09770 [Nevskia sp.]
MNKMLLVALLASAAAGPAMAAVGVSVNIGEPGFYGRIDIGSYPQPQVVYAEPIIIERRQVVEQPVYLRVPPGHQRDWKHYCGRYGACGRPVYFVRDDWYENTYVPQYREKHGHGHDGDEDHGHGDDDHGGGHGKGHGGDHGHGHGDH